MKLPLELEPAYQLRDMGSKSLGLFFEGTLKTPIGTINERAEGFRGLGAS